MVEKNELGWSRAIRRRARDEPMVPLAPVIRFLAISLFQSEVW